MPMKYGRAQRRTLTYSQMHGAGHQEGMGLFGDIGKWFSGAAKKSNKYLKKTNLLSNVGSVVGPMIGVVHPGAGNIVSKGAKFAKQAGYGKPKGYRVPAALSAAQIKCLRMGHGRYLQSGGVSLAMSRRMGYPRVKNVSPAQMKALNMGMGRMLKSGGVSLRGGPPSGYYKRGMAPRVLAKPRYKGGAYGGAYGGAHGYGGAHYGGAAVYGAGSALPGGAGVKLAGQGVRTYRKKRIHRPKAPMVYRY